MQEVKSRFQRHQRTPSTRRGPLRSTSQRCRWPSATRALKRAHHPNRPNPSLAVPQELRERALRIIRAGGAAEAITGENALPDTPPNTLLLLSLDARGGDRSPPRTPSLRGHRKRCTARLPLVSTAPTSRPPPPPPPPHHRRTTAAPPPHRCWPRVGPFFLFRGGRFLDRIRLFFVRMSSCRVRWPHTVDEAGHGLVFGRVRARLCVLICV